MSDSSLDQYISDIEDSTVDDLKLVLVNLAKNNIGRMYRLSTALSSIENKLIDKSLEDDIDLRELMDIYHIIRTSVQDLTGLITNITNDPTIISIIMQNNQVIQNNTIVETESDLLDKDSRMKVRQALDNILNANTDIYEVVDDDNKIEY